tara:strand:+ start:408 stop:992 length:585 start_codon:yes stop_codon:yes gene_type:complete
MVKLIGSRKLNTAVFISGRGSNLKFLIKYAKKKTSPIEIILVISSNKFAKGLSYAKINKINFLSINYKNKSSAENKILKLLQKKQVKLICLAGFMKILSKKFIGKFEGKILNIHPSLLPKYKGLKTHQRVMDNNEKYSGSTVHLVNNRLDSGKIILQKKIKILKNDNPASLKKRILKIEHEIYPKAINKLLFNY